MDDVSECKQKIPSANIRKRLIKKNDKGFNIMAFVAMSDEKHLS